MLRTPQALYEHLLNPRGPEFKVVRYLLDSPKGEVSGADGREAARGEGWSRPPPYKPPGPREEGSVPSRSAGLACGVSFRHVAWKRRGNEQRSQQRGRIRGPWAEPHPPGRLPLSEWRPSRGDSAPPAPRGDSGDHPGQIWRALSPGPGCARGSDAPQRTRAAAPHRARSDFSSGAARSRP